LLSDRDGNPHDDETIIVESRIDDIAEWVWEEVGTPLGTSGDDW
jgi:hypothetical protein